MLYNFIYFNIYEGNIKYFIFLVVSIPIKYNLKTFGFSSEYLVTFFLSSN